MPRGKSTKGKKTTKSPAKAGAKRGRKRGLFKAAVSRTRIKFDQAPKLVRGFKDVLPEEQKYWNYIIPTMEEIVKEFSFNKIDLPILEETSLFVRAVGKDTDVVEKELISFMDQSGEHLCLRPEVTASIARAYIAHGMMNLSQPVRLYTYGPMFRRERPQSGRQRQFNQFNYEVIGDISPSIDAIVIYLTYKFFQEIKLKVKLEINSIGCPGCREEYKNNLIEYYKSRKADLCADCKKRITKNPLRLLDCKECLEVKEEAPQIVDFLCDECQKHFFKVLEFLDEFEVPYNLSPFLVRGLDYYTKTVFEIVPDAPEEEKKSQSSLAGGGRYDLLLEQLGGKPAPACGAAIGLERTILQIKAQETKVPEDPAPDVFLAQLGDQAKKKSLSIFEELKSERINVVENIPKDSLRAQLDQANKLGAKLTLILGQKEILDETILLRDMEAHSQEVISRKNLVPELKKRIIEIKKELAKRPKIKKPEPEQVPEEAKLEVKEAGKEVAEEKGEFVKGGEVKESKL